ncbi:hypothetical protein JB92DRAFT_3118799 [Gautieria morchelliformis]|nr:hypothetical protein JB92DRAFT_3118799 [Gautieria morchelliformis]
MHMTHEATKGNQNDYPQGASYQTSVGLGMGHTVSQGQDASPQPTAAKTSPSRTLAHEGTDTQAVLELEESRNHWEKAADVWKCRYHTQELRELDNDSQANESEDETSLAPAQTSSRKPMKWDALLTPLQDANLAALQFTSSLIAAPEKPHAKMRHAPNAGPLQPIGTIQANGPLLSHPSQHAEPASPLGTIWPVLHPQPLTMTHPCKQASRTGNSSLSPYTGLQFRAHGTGNGPHPSSTDLLRSSFPLSFHSHSPSSKVPTGLSSIEASGREVT